jgi:5,10-methylene-tetrahydrofolate dehydrogenase/methenyl tetrahydrofolate cyclohydrolase
MSAKIIDGNAIAAEIRQDIKSKLEKFRQEHGEDAGKPGLAVLLVGDRKDSATYVRMKKRVASELGFYSVDTQLSGEATQEEVIQKVRDFNADPNINGILVQLPLPKHINEEVVLREVSLEKDVDGFHPINIGNLSMKGREPTFVPCTPKGCIELLDRVGVSLAGKNAVVLGRSNIVGIPVAMLLLHRNATVTICHSQSRDVKEKVQQADILIAACGQPEYVRGDWIKPGAIVIDVGINPVDDSSKKTGYRLVGDVCYDEAVQVAGYITPVPGGVGPMTIAMLMLNTWTSFLRTSSK